MAHELFEWLTESCLPAIVHKAHHDLEFFIWVTIYAILKHELLAYSDIVITKPTCGKMPHKFEEFRRHFPDTDHAGDLEQPRERIEVHHLNDMVSSKPVRTLIKDLVVAGIEPKPSLRPP
jgi:hypothetical protein